MLMRNNTQVGNGGQKRRPGGKRQGNNLSRNVKVSELEAEFHIFLLSICNIFIGLSMITLSKKLSFNYPRSSTSS